MAAKTIKAKAVKVNGQTALERASQRAAASGLAIVGRGWRVADGALAWAIPSQSEPGKRHMVVLVGAHLECDCKGYTDYALTCVHIGMVANEIAAEAASFAATQRTLAEASATMARVEARLDADDAARASAPLARDNRPLSIWRA